MYGAISNVFDKPLFMTSKGTNIVGWQMFLRHMKQLCEAKYISDNPVLIIDGHSAHRSPKVDYSGFKVLMTPPYTSYLNSQETVWSVLKRQLFGHFARLDYELKKFVDVEREINVVIKSFTK